MDPRISGSERRQHNEPTIVDFPWHQLTSLSLRITLPPMISIPPFPVASVLDILHKCSRLKELKLIDSDEGREDQWTLFAKSEMVTFSSLTKLAVPFCDHVLLAVRCPVLETLEVFHPTSSGSLPMITFLSVCEPTLCSLRLTVTETTPCLSLPHPLNHLVLQFSRPSIIEDFIYKHSVRLTSSLHLPDSAEVGYTQKR